jgi:phosphoribosylformylglycinamidine synthase
MAEFLALRGAAAFSASRLARLQKSVGEQFAGVTLAAEHWYFVELERALSADEQSRLGDLLGIPSPLPAAPAGSLLLVTPRLGTISPWSSKATDIARNCGFAAVKRIERGTAYHLAGKGQESALATRRISTLLHDRMTESVLDSIDAARELFHHVAPQPLTTVDILGGGKCGAGARPTASWAWPCPMTRSTIWSSNFGKLGRNPTDVELMMFAQANSEHCRHKIFNASVDGGWRRPVRMSLFGMIRETHKAHPGRHGGGLFRQRLGGREGATIQRFLSARRRQLCQYSRSKRPTSWPRWRRTTIPTAIAPFRWRGHWVWRRDP